jgi:hypothetical protein
VAERARVVPLGSPGVAVSPVLRGMARGWMQAKLRALTALTRRIEAGEMLEKPVRAAIAVKSAEHPGVRAPLPPEERLPRGFGWMCAFEAKLREDGAAFAAWLSEPAMRAKVLAAPERMARVIGPILNAAGASRPDWFPTRATGRKTSFPPCGGREGWAVEAADSFATVDYEPEADCGNAARSECFEVPPDDDGSRGRTPPLTPPTRGRTFSSASINGEGYRAPFVQALAGGPKSVRRKHRFLKIVTIRRWETHAYFITICYRILIAFPAQKPNPPIA